MLLLVGCTTTAPKENQSPTLFVDDFMMTLKDNQMTPSNRFFLDDAYNDPIDFENEAFMLLILPLLTDFDYEILDVNETETQATISIRFITYNFYGFLNELSPLFDELIQTAIDEGMSEEIFEIEVISIVEAQIQSIRKDLSSSAKMNLVKKDGSWFIHYDDDYIDLFLILTGHLFLEN